MCIGPFLFSDHCVKQIDWILPWVCSVIDHRGLKVVKTSVTLACATSLYLPHLKLLLNRRTATCNVFVKWNNIPLEIRSCESLNDFKNKFKPI